MDKKQYHESWSDTIRPAILKRDNYKCKRCKVKHRAIGYWHILQGFVECDELMVTWAKARLIKCVRIILQVHHVDGNKSNNEYTNLTTLCSRCHLFEERQLNVLKRKVVYKKV